MKAFFLAWNEKRDALVWNGVDWRASASEPDHRKKAKLVRHDVARENLMAMRCRFPGLEIIVCPLAEKKDVAKLIEKRRRR